MSQTHRYTGFSSRPKPKFTPTDEQVGTCARRLEAAVIKRGGAINACSFGDIVDFGEKSVFNRANELGDRKAGEFRKVVIAAAKQLLEERCEYDEERGLFIVQGKFVRRGRVHESKRPPYRNYREPRKIRAQRRAATA